VFLIKSFSAKIKQLLNDKKMLLIQNKKDCDRLTKEKEEAVQQMTECLDHATKESREKMEEAERDLEKTQNELAALHVTHTEELKVTSTLNADTIK
jgi:hypothetical protein